jgi:hypothetical protein
MDPRAFDDLIRSLTGSRRLLLVGAVAVAGGWLGPTAAGAKRRRQQRSRFNQFGCLDVGEKCYGKDAHCCSGICRGKKNKSRCIAHDSGLCTPQQDSCGPGGNFVCDPADKEPYFCVVTTGKAAFCGDFSDPPVGDLCRSCRRDRDCEDELGPGAACIIFQGDCPAFCTTTDGTACVLAAPIPRGLAPR